MSLGNSDKIYWRNGNVNLFQQDSQDGQDARKLFLKAAHERFCTAILSSVFVDSYPDTWLYLSLHRSLNSLEL